MRYEDINTVEDGYRPQGATYWIGGTRALSAGDYEFLRPAIALAKGNYTEYQGECGQAATLSDKAPKRVVVATWKPSDWSRGRYDKNHWVVKVINAGSLLITDAEYRERVRLQAEDLKRHQAQRAEVRKQRKVLSDVIVGELLNGLAPHAELTIHRPGRPSKMEPINRVSIYIELTPAQLRKKLTPAARKAFDELPKIKDPTC